MNTKTVYSFDPNTRAYLGPMLLDAGDLSPLDLAEGREVWCLPGNTLEVAPPTDVPTGKCAVAADGEWVIRDTPASQDENIAEAAAKLYMAVKTHLDAQARAQGFDSIADAVTYAGSSVPKYCAKGRAFMTMRDSTREIVDPLLDAIAAGDVPLMTAAELLPKLPGFDLFTATADEREMQASRDGNDATSADALLTEAQAAALLSIAPATLTAWRTTKRAAQPAYCRIGGAVRYRRSDLAAFIEHSVQTDA